MSENHGESLPPPVTLSGSSEDVQHDDLERGLKLRSTNDPEVQTFLLDYSRCKKQKGVKFFTSVVGYDLFQPPCTFQSPFLPDLLSRQREEKTSFSDLLKLLRPELHTGTTDCARFLVLLSSASDSVQSGMYPLSTKVFATVKQLQRKYTAPKLAILYLIDQQWNLSETTLKGCVGALKREKGGWSLNRPSQSLGRTPFRIGSRDEMTLELAWLASVPKYYGQMSTYIWQPHVEPPEPINARLSIQGVCERGCRNVLLLLTSPEHSNRLLSEYQEQRRDRLPGYSSTLSTVEGEILLAIYNVYMMLITDTTAFIERAVEQINGLKYSGRHRPSSSMIHYLLHLEDCCRGSSSGLEHASLLMQEISGSVASDHSQLDAVLRAWPVSALEDLAFLQKELEQTQKYLLNTREMINELLTLRNGRRTSLLTLLAAIYIPFSFMSSLFGMNLSAPIWGPVIPNSPNSTNSTSNPSLPSSTPTLTSSMGFSQDQTNAIIAEISSSGPYLWSFKLYWIIIGPTTLTTILLPLIAGPVLRLTLKTFHRNRIYLRPLVALLCLGALVALDEFIPPIIYLYLFGISFGSVAGYTLTRASYTGKDQLIWCGYSIIFAASFTMDRLIDSLVNVGICGYMSLTYLILVWLRPEVEELVGRRFAQLLQKIMRHFATIQRKTLGKIHALDSNLIIRKAIALIIYYGLAFLIYHFLPIEGSLPFFCIPQGVLATNRMIRSARTGQFFPHWLIYATIFWMSFTIDYVSSVYGLTCFFPMGYLFSLWIFPDCKAFFYKQQQRLSEFELNRRNV